MTSGEVSGDPAAGGVRDPGQESRLGIAHLILWTTGTAVAFSVQKWLGTEDERPDTAATVYSSIWAISHGAALGALAVWAARRMRGLRFPAAPGETLLLAVGLFTAFDFASTAVLRGAYGEFNEASFRAVRILMLAQMLVGGLIFVVAALRTRVVRWQLFLAVQSVFIVLWHFDVLLDRRGQLAVAVMSAAFLVYLALADRRAQESLPWTHWAGVFAVLLGELNLAGFSLSILWREAA